VSRRRVEIISWNVNGIRSAAKKGFFAWLERRRPDIIGLQETRIDDESLLDAHRTPRRYHSAWSFPLRKGYSGCATFSRVPALSSRALIGTKRFDIEGRVVETEHDRFLVFNVYFPKGSGTMRDNSRVPYKLAFYNALFKYAHQRRAETGKPLVVMGDFNTAHQPIDLKNWRSNQENSGFLPVERASFSRHLKRGFVDSYRHLYPEREQYSWWSNRLGCRERNIGWRIDYVWLSNELVPHLKDAFILDQVKGSDHCPVGVILDI
jgi:exodeoxyribonuclease III